VTQPREPGSPVAEPRPPDAPPGQASVEPATRDRFRVADLVREHPWITAIMLVCTVGGALAGPTLFDPDWTLLRQVAAGAFCGAWVGITLTVTKMIGD